MSPVYKLSNAGGMTSKQRYTSMLAGNPVFIDGSYESIQTVTVGAGGSASVTFAGIPTSGYAHLQMRISGKGNNAATFDSAELQFNADTATNYTLHWIQGDGSTINALGLVPRSGIRCAYLGGATAPSLGSSIVDILDYANINKNKTVRSLTGNDGNGSGTVELISGVWLNTTAVNSIKIYPVFGSLFSEFTTFALYGVK